MRRGEGTPPYAYVIQPHDCLRRGEGTPPYGCVLHPHHYAIPFTNPAMSAITSYRTWEGVTYSVVSRRPWVGIIR